MTIEHKSATEVKLDANWKWMGASPRTGVYETERAKTAARVAMRGGSTVVGNHNSPSRKRNRARRRPAHLGHGAMLMRAGRTSVRPRRSQLRETQRGNRSLRSICAKKRNRRNEQCREDIKDHGHKRR